MFLGGTHNVRGLFTAAISFCCTFALTGGHAGAQQPGGIVPATDNTSKAIANTKSAADTPNPASENSKPTSGKSELEEMSATIRQLEDRIRELEAKLARIESAAAQPTRVDGAKPAGLITAPAPAGTEVAQASDEPKKDDRKQEEHKQKENEGILSFFRGTEISGLVDGYYGYNFNHPAGD